MNAHMYWCKICVIKQMVFLCAILLLSVIIYILWQVTNGRKELIRRLRQQIVNVSLF